MEGVRHVFQPVVELQSGRVVGHEALLRAPEGPRLWFERVRRGGAEAVLGWDRRLRSRALDIAARRGYRGVLFVNVAPETVRALCEGEVGRLRTRHMPKHRVVWELSEGDWPLGEEGLRRLRRAAGGVELALDDVGAGRADLARLGVLAPEWVKLDRSLVSRCDERPAQRAVIRGVLAMAASWGAEVVAEGIERPEELAVVRSLGVRWGQGWLLGRPGPLGEPDMEVRAGVLRRGEIA